MSSTPARRTLFSGSGTPAAKRRKGTTSTGMQLHKAIMRNVETKHYQTTSTTPGGSFGFSYSVFAGLDSGSGGTQRLGNKIKVQSIDVAVHTSFSSPVRVRLICDRGSGAPPSALTPHTAFFDPNQFWVIKDFYMNPSDPTGEMGIVFTHKFGLGKNVTWSGGTILSENIYLVISSNDEIGENIVRASTQVNFKDL